MAWVRNADPDHVMAFFHVIKGIVHVDDSFFVQLRLPVKRECLDHKLFRYLGTGHSHFSGVLLFYLILLLNNMGQQTGMRVIALLSKGQIPVPVRQKAPKPEIFKHMFELFIHCQCP
jgi:hypothetical protein